PDYRLLRTRFILLGSILFTLLFSTTLVSLLSPTWITPARAQSAPEAIHGTTIVVDTSADLDTSATKTCSFTQFTFVPAGDGCTLRRAIVEASARPQTQRPVTITFNLPPGDAVDGVWTLPLDDALVLYTSNDTNGLNNNGSVTLDGG